MRAFVQARFVVLTAVALTACSPVRLGAGEVVGEARNKGGERRGLPIAVQTVDCGGVPIPGATLEEDVYGQHPKGYQPPTYRADQNGYVKLVCATNSAGISIQADGFFGATVRSELLSVGITNRVRLRRDRLVDHEVEEKGPKLPACRSLVAPAELTDADVISVIRSAVAAPGMRDLPQQLWSIRIKPYKENDGLARLRIRFNWNGGFDTHAAVVTRTKDSWRVDSAGRIVE